MYVKSVRFRLGFIFCESMPIPRRRPVVCPTSQRCIRVADGYSEETAPRKPSFSEPIHKVGHGATNTPAGTKQNSSGSLSVADPVIYRAWERRKPEGGRAQRRLSGRSRHFEAIRR